MHGPDESKFAFANLRARSGNRINSRKIGVMLRNILLFIAATVVSGCAQQPSYQEQLNKIPMPTNEQEKQRQCASIRSEIARQQSVAQYGASIATTPMMAMAFQTKARNNIAALESRAADMQCNAAFSSVIAQPSPASPSGHLGFDDCFSKCQQYTNKTKDQCFDTCK